MMGIRAYGPSTAKYSAMLKVLKKIEYAKKTAPRHESPTIDTAFFTIKIFGLKKNCAKAGVA